MADITAYHDDGYRAGIHQHQHHQHQQMAHLQQQQQQGGYDASSSPHLKQQQRGGAKGASLGHAHAPSKVLHIRGLPPYTSEQDLLAFFASLPSGGGSASPSSGGGVVLTRILLLPNSNQAFIQLTSVEAAAALLQLQQHQGGAFVMAKSKSAAGGSGAGSPTASIIVQYSNRQEIHTPLTQQQATAAAAGGSSAAPQQLQGGMSSVGGGIDSQSQANSILLVTVLNTRVPVTLDHIHQIFKPYGDVLKIITFHKAGVFKALVQLGSLEAAVNARMLLEGKDIFQGCCHLRIGFSSLQELSVKTPGNNARDFTSPSGATQTYAQGTAEGAGYAHGGHPQAAPYQQGLINGAGYGAPPAAGGYQDQGYGSSAHSHAHSAHSSSTGHPAHPPHAPGCVVLVSNLPDERVTCDVLFTLFGVYGDVLRVKILYNKRDTALVQYVSPQSAYLAALHLNHLHLYGKQISVTPSKHVEVSLPKSGPNGGTQQDQEQHQSGLTQDYTHSPIHRFKRTSGAASATSAAGGLGIHAKSIHPPTQVLHVSSLADQVTEDELRSLFGSLTTAGEASSSPAAAAAAASPEQQEKVLQAPPVVQFFTSLPRALGGGGLPVGSSALKASKQAFLRFETVSSAVESLIAFHNYSLHGRYLRISFSPRQPDTVKPTNAKEEELAAAQQALQAQGQQQLGQSQPQAREGADHGVDPPSAEYQPQQPSPHQHQT